MSRKANDVLMELGACHRAMRWVMNRPAPPQKLWDKCDRADWMLWLLHQCNYHIEEPYDHEEIYENQIKILADLEGPFQHYAEKLQALISCGSRDDFEHSRLRSDICHLQSELCSIGKLDHELDLIADLLWDLSYNYQERRLPVEMWPHSLRKAAADAVRAVYPKQPITAEVKRATKDIW